MSIPRPIVRAYIELAEDLLNLNDLTDAETEAVQDRLDRLTAMLTSERDGEHNSRP